MVLSSKKEMRNICIYGVGGVGGYFGGKIAFTTSQLKGKTKNVSFIARGSHLQEIRKNGLILNTSVQNGLICKPDIATDDIDEIPAPDVCLICVKSYDLEGVVKTLKRKIKNQTVIIPLLNGVDIYERIRSVINNGIILPSCVYVGTHREKPGVVTQKGGDGIILSGFDPQFTDYNPDELTHFFHEREITFECHDDPYKPIWEKYIFIASFGLVTAYAKKTLGEVLSDQVLKELVRKIMGEIISITERKGIKLPEDTANKSIEKAYNFPFETKTSYQRDIEIKGQLNEGDIFGRTIIRIGKALGVPTPVTQSMYNEIQKNTG